MQPGDSRHIFICGEPGPGPEGRPAISMVAPGAPGGPRGPGDRFQSENKIPKTLTKIEISIFG